MNASIVKASKRTVSAIIVMSVIAAMILTLFPATAGPGPIGATVTGTVTDINDGEPIEDAKVTISYHGIVRSDLTDGNGKYTFMNVPECFCLKNIKVTKDGYRSESEDVGVSGVTVVDFELLYMEKEPYFGTIEGTVTDVNDGQPLDGAKVVLEYHEHIRETYTDANGEYQFTEVPECFCLKKVTASMEHYRPETQEVGVAGVTIVDFQLMTEEKEPDEGTLHGWVIDADTGDPIVGALVVVNHDGQEWRTVTDGEGNYMLTGLPLCRCMKETSVSADGYITEKGLVAIGLDTEMNIALEPEEDQGSQTPMPPIRKAPESMRDRPYAMAGLVTAGVGLAAMSYYAFMARE